MKTTKKNIKKKKKKRPRRKFTKTRKLHNNMKLYYVNINGYKSKIISTQRIIEEVDPDIIGLTETKMEKEEPIDFNGQYTIHRNDRNKDGGGVLIAIKKIYEHLIYDIREYSYSEESIWMDLNGKKKYRIGVIYMPDENKTSIAEFKKIYSRIRNEVSNAKVEERMIIIMGDFNCKLCEPKLTENLLKDDAYDKQVSKDDFSKDEKTQREMKPKEESNGVRVLKEMKPEDKSKGGRVLKEMKPEEESKGGKVLKEMMEEEELETVNNMKVCTGCKWTWTRTVLGVTKKSTLDYILVEKENSNSINEAHIDEEKEITPYHETTHRTYTDHRAMTVTINTSVLATYDNRKKKVMTSKGYKKFSDLLKKNKVSQIWKDQDTIHNIYRKWSNKVIEIKNQCMTNRKKKNKSRKVKQLKNILKQLKRYKERCKDTAKKEVLRNRMRFIRIHIENQLKREKANKIFAAVNKIRKSGGGFNETSFWEVKKEILGKRKCENKTINKENGERTCKKEEVLQTYKNFYEQLFKSKERNQEKSSIIEKKLDKIIQSAKTQRPITIDDKDIEEGYKKLKRKKAEDFDGWKNELILAGGTEMKISLKHMCNKIFKDLITPEQWDHVIVKSIYKNKGAKLEMENRRGIFLTMILSKFFENMILRNDTSRMYPWQNGGGKRRSDIDNSLIINAIIDNNRRLNKKTYFIFADAVKCFDNLWLQDCLIDLCDLGMREREIALIYQLNKKIKVIVDTPVGRTEAFSADNIVKQGSVCATKLCCASTGKINLMSAQESYSLTPNINLKSIVFVDDISGGGSPNVVKGVEKNLQLLENEKGFVFGTKKTNYMVINTGREKEVKLNLEIKQGQIKKESEYECLGILYHENGTIENHLKTMAIKGITMLKEGAKIGHQHNVGELSTVVQLFLYEKVIVNSITHNLAAVNYWRKSDIDKLEKLQAKLLRMILKLPESTPYWGLLNELGIWPLQDILNYKKLMLLQNLITSDDSRLTKKLIEHQKNFQVEASWYVNVKNIANEYEIDIDDENNLEIKQRWKKYIKEKILKNIITRSERKTESMKKLRHQMKQSFSMQAYIKETNICRVKDLIKCKLEMLDIGGNHGNNRTCYGCNRSEETTEHIINCTSTKNLIGIKNRICIDNMSDKSTLMKLHNFMKAYIEKRDDIKESVNTFDENEK